MNVWILTIWEDGGVMNEVMAVLFNQEAVMPKVHELMEDPQVISVTVETWYRDMDEPDASYYEKETFWNEKEEA